MTVGTYYKAACDDLREHIDPGYINDLGVKDGPIANPKHPFGSVVVFALLNRWSGKECRLANDCGEDPGYFEYKDVTKEVIEAYNLRYKTDLQYTGDTQTCQ